jgi:hypothetical protein
METLTYISARSYLSVNSILELPNERSMLSVYAFGYFTNHEGVDGLQSNKRGYSGPNFHGLEALSPPLAAMAYAPTKTWREEFE